MAARKGTVEMTDAGNAGGFQVIEADNRRGPREVTEPQVSFNGTNAQFRLNRLAVEALGNPDKVQVMYDPDTNRIAFVPSDADSAVQLRREDADSPNRYFGFRTLSNKLGMQENRGKATLTQDAETGYWVVEVAPLMANPIVKRGPRKAKEAASEETEAAE